MTHQGGGRPAISGAQRAFTLVEMLVVIMIIGLLAIATLPVVVPTLQQSQINNAARQLQAELAAKRDQAIRTNRPAGIRFLPDSFTSGNGLLVSSRYISIERGPDYSEGMVQRLFDLTGAPIPPGYPPPIAPLPTNPPIAVPGTPYPYLVLREEKFTTTIVGPLPNPSTSWYFNVRQGDRLRLNDSGKEYTIAGPAGNPGQAASFTAERFINFGTAYLSNPTNYPAFEFLFLVDGTDNDGDGYVDEGFDGINNDGDVYPTGHPLAGQPIIDPGFNGIDDNGDGLIDEWVELYLHCNADGSYSYPGLPGTLQPNGLPWVPPFPNEYEQETFSGRFAQGVASSYTIFRRPVPSETGQQTNLPTGVSLDLTTWNATAPYVPERSRLPVDPATGYVDILIAPGGQVIQQSAHSNSAPQTEMPFYHFWLADSDDLHAPFTPGVYPYLLPMLNGSNDDPNLPLAPSAGPYPPPPGNAPVLKGNRRLLSLNTRTGQISTTSVETFYTNNPSYPFKAAEAGIKEEP